MRNVLYSIFVIVFSFAACQSRKPGQSNDATKEAKVQENILEKVDALDIALKEALGEMKVVASLDHHRMAKELGVYTPPAIATIASDPRINTELLYGNDPLIGLDLPTKFLCYSEPDTAKGSIAYTSAEFIAKRHGLSNEQMTVFANRLKEVSNTLDPAAISSTNLESVNSGFGIVKLKSDFDFPTTLENLEQIINAQSDTRWFGTIDFQQEASDLGQEINPNKLLLFGGPGPGGQAMMTSPKIGLDAFCQKLLVYQSDDGSTWIAFNDIVAFAELYYGASTKPQQMINQRLTATFTKVITKTQ